MLSARNFKLAAWNETLRTLKIKNLGPVQMIMCPAKKRPIPTGLTTKSVIFESLPDINMPIRCPGCGRHHVWSRKRAWVATSDLSSRQVLQFDQVLRRA